MLFSSTTPRRLLLGQVPLYSSYKLHDNTFRSMLDRNVATKNGFFMASFATPNQRPSQSSCFIAWAYSLDEIASNSPDIGSLTGAHIGTTSTLTFITGDYRAQYRPWPRGFRAVLFNTYSTLMLDYPSTKTWTMHLRSLADDWLAAPYWMNHAHSNHADADLQGPIIWGLHAPVVSPV